MSPGPVMSMTSPDAPRLAAAVTADTAGSGRRRPSVGCPSLGLGRPALGAGQCRLRHHDEARRPVIGAQQTNGPPAHAAGVACRRGAGRRTDGRPRDGVPHTRVLAHDACWGCRDRIGLGQRYRGGQAAEAAGGRPVGPRRRLGPGDLDRRRGGGRARCCSRRPPRACARGRPPGEVRRGVERLDLHRHCPAGSLEVPALGAATRLQRVHERVGQDDDHVLAGGDRLVGGTERIGARSRRRVLQGVGVAQRTEVAGDPLGPVPVLAGVADQEVDNIARLRWDHTARLLWDRSAVAHHLTRQSPRACPPCLGPMPPRALACETACPRRPARAGRARRSRRAPRSLRATSPPHRLLTDPSSSCALPCHVDAACGRRTRAASFGFGVPPVRLVRTWSRYTDGPRLHPVPMPLCARRLAGPRSGRRPIGPRRTRRLHLAEAQNMRRDSDAWGWPAARPPGDCRTAMGSGRASPRRRLSRRAGRGGAGGNRTLVRRAVTVRATTVPVGVVVRLPPRRVEWRSP